MLLHKKKLSIIKIVLIIIPLFLFFVFITKKPSSDRAWDKQFDILPTANIKDNQIEIKNIRDWNYDSENILNFEYVDRVYDINKLTRVWFLVEPFTGWDKIAHTFFSFEFEDQPPISFSIEARRETHEDYSPIKGLYREYELAYTWGTEEDFIGRRVIYLGNDVSMYPLNISSENAKKYFLKLIEETNSIDTTPRFYNTLTSNCTNNLAIHANQIVPGTLPWDISRLLPGYSVEYLYRLGFIENTSDLENMKSKHNITNDVKEYYNKEDFSTNIRQRLYN